MFLAIRHRQIVDVQRLPVHVPRHRPALRTERENKLPNVEDLTVEDVSAYSFRFWPVLWLSSWNVNTPARSVTAIATEVLWVVSATLMAVIVCVPAVVEVVVVGPPIVPNAWQPAPGHLCKM
jgi:hypothetical protein